MRAAALPDRDGGDVAPDRDLPRLHRRRRPALGLDGQHRRAAAVDHRPGIGPATGVDLDPLAVEQGIDRGWIPGRPGIRTGVRPPRRRPRVVVVIVDDDDAGAGEHGQRSEREHGEGQS
jgi:hypothetical protein